MRPLAWLGAALLPLVGCAHLPDCPQEGGPPWTEWQTPHFRFITDLPDSDAEQTAQAFETVREALVYAAWRKEPDPPAPIDVVVLASRTSLLAVRPAYVEGTFFTPTSWHDGLVLVSGRTPPEGSETVKHELVHALAWRFGVLRSNSPRWLVEGLAVYLSTTRFSSEAHEVDFGEPHRESLTTLVRVGALDFEELWRPPTVEGSYYATSWLLVHYLFNHRADGFRLFQTRLRDSNDPRALWGEVFPDWTVRQVMIDLNNYYANQGQFYRYRARFAPAHVAITSRPLSHAAVHGWRAQLFGLASLSEGRRDESRALAAKEAAAALVEDPLELQANLVRRILLGENADLDGARRLAERHTQSPRAWWALGEALLAKRQTGEAQAAFAKAVTLSRAEAGGIGLDGARPAQPY